MTLLRNSATQRPTSRPALGAGRCSRTNKGSSSHCNLRGWWILALFWLYLGPSFPDVWNKLRVLIHPSMVSYIKTYTIGQLGIAQSQSLQQTSYTRMVSIPRNHGFSTSQRGFHRDSRNGSCRLVYNPCRTWKSNKKMWRKKSCPTLSHLWGVTERWFLIFKLSVARGDLVAPRFLGLV